MSECKNKNCEKDLFTVILNYYETCIEINDGKYLKLLITQANKISVSLGLK